MIKLFLIISIAICTNATQTPIIGLLSQEAFLVHAAFPQAHSFIAASYVKLLEGSGARVLPVWVGQDDSYYEKVVNYTNGIVFPGGGTYFNETGGYGEAARKLYQLALKTNRNGVHYPVWGVCLGHQVLMFAELGEDIRADCQSKDVALPLDFTVGYEKSKLFANASQELLEIFKTQNVTYNYHGFCLFEESLKQNGILENWSIISTNKDVYGVEFISTMEHKSYPFYGTQYHPEKNLFEFKRSTKIPHSIEAVDTAQYLANTFLYESRQNNHTFPTTDIEDKTLIYNYNPVYSASNTSYEQLYLFTSRDYIGLL